MNATYQLIIPPNHRGVRGDLLLPEYLEMVLDSVNSPTTTLVNVYTSSLSNPYPHPQVESFTVRHARTQDLGAVSEVLTHSFHSCQGWGILMYPFLKLGIYEDIRSRLCGDRAHYGCLVATTTSDKIVGVVELGLSCPEGWIPKQYESTYISNLAVSPNYRRQGIARHLLRSCEKLTSEWGFRSVYLHVLDNNQQAQQLYDQCGYQLKRVEPSLTAWLFQQPRRLLLGKSLSPKIGG